MTSFTTEDRISAEQTSIQEYQTQIGFTNLIDDCYRLIKRCNNFETEIRLKMVANTIDEIGKDYHAYKQYAREYGHDSKTEQMTLKLQDNNE
jgi:hypothetical protein